MEHRIVTCAGRVRTANPKVIIQKEFACGFEKQTAIATVA